jgi:hypothetical protein
MNNFIGKLIAPPQLGAVFRTLHDAKARRSVDLIYLPDAPNFLIKPSERATRSKRSSIGFAFG